MFGLFDKTFGVFLIKYETVIYMELCIYGSTFHFAMAQSFFLKFDKDGWWFEHFVSQLRVCLSAEGAKNVSWPWLSPLQGWGSLTMVFTGKFVQILRGNYHDLSLVRVN